MSLKIGSKAVDDKVAESVWGFFYLCDMFYVVASFFVSNRHGLKVRFLLLGHVLNNLGPGLGQVAETYGSVDGFGKSILALAMILED